MSSTDIVQKPSSEAQRARDLEIIRWQRRLLPFMSRFLVVLAIGFFAISLVDMYEMHNSIQGTENTRAKVEQLLQAKGNEPRGQVDVVQQGLLLLEVAALENRYRLASSLLTSRIRTRQLSFITGMDDS